MITQKYYWKELTSEGHLKEPEPLDIHGDTVLSNNWEGFDLKADAIKALEWFEVYWKTNAGINKEGLDLKEFVLVKIYRRYENPEDVET